MIGKTIGSYRVIDQIGMGGMATVYKAYDPGTDRYVALKILPEHFTAEPTFRERFQIEARAIAKLEHLHILPVYSYGEENGTAYLVMRYMETGTLADLLKKGGLSFRDIILILDQLAGALDYAHERGVLHRDVKSSNVLLDGKLNAYLTDFGIAKIVESANDITGANLIGTPQYMSPEQCKGGNKLTPATDQYSLGVVLFEMLTGQLPYQADTPMAVMLMQMHDILPSARKHRPDMTTDMEKVLEQALAKEPADRFTTCSVLASAFTAAVNSYPPLPRTILSPAKPTILRGKLEDIEEVDPAITDQPKHTVSLAPQSDQINAVAFAVALVAGGAIAMCSAPLFGIPIFLQMANGALYVYLARRAGQGSGPVTSAIAAGVASLIGGVAAALIASGVLIASGFLDQSPFRSVAALVAIFGPMSGIFGAVGGFAASRLMPLDVSKMLVKPAEKPAAKQADNLAVKPADKPAEKAEAKSPETPAVKPINKPQIKLTGKPDDKPDTPPLPKPAAQSEDKSDGKPPEKPFGTPPDKPSTNIPTIPFKK